MSSKPPAWPLTLLNGAVLMLLSGTALGQATATDSNAQTMDAVVVTASGFEQAVEDAPASITVITG